MRTNAWLTVNKRGSMRLTKNQPNLDPDEVSIKLELNLPDELFKRPRLMASVTIPQEAASPDEITAKTVEDCKDAIKQVTGLEMSIKVVKEEEQSES